MSRIVNHRHMNLLNHSNPRALSASRLLVALGGLALFLGLASQPGPAHAATSAAIAAQRDIKASVSDPLAGDVWHAVDSSWPGTLVFNAKKKTVVLTPVGAEPMTATYTYTVKPAFDKKSIEGTLRMTNSEQQVSTSSFKIVGKRMTLSFTGGPNLETYVRMTPKEEEDERARLQKMLKEGRIRPIQ